MQLGLVRPRLHQRDPDPERDELERSASIIPSSAHLEAWYGAAIGTATRPETDPMVTMAPAPRARMAGSTARVTRWTPMTLVSSWARSSSGEVSSSGPKQ